MANKEPLTSDQAPRLICPKCELEIPPGQTVCEGCGAAVYPRPSLAKVAPKWAFVTIRIVTGIFAIAGLVMAVYVFAGGNILGYLDNLQVAEVLTFVFISFALTCIYVDKNLRKPQ